MDRLTFVTEIVKATAWPGATLLLALLLRRPILSLLEGLKLRKLKRGDWEAEFSEMTDEVRRDLPEGAAGTSVNRGELVGELEPVLRTSPTEAILSAWNRIERAVHSLGDQHGIRSAAFMPTLTELVERKIVPEATKHSLLGLRQLRNLAVHGPTGEISEARGREFLTMAEAVLWVLRSNMDSEKVLKSSS